MGERHKATVEHVGAGGGACWIAKCTCGWRWSGASSHRSVARDYADHHAVITGHDGGTDG